jgi:hypothetical protein
MPLAGVVFFGHLVFGDVVVVVIIIIASTGVGVILAIKCSPWA